jgi:hypothetical protein
MARLSNAPTNTLHRDLPEKDKTRLALEWLRDNPSETANTAARIYHIKNEKSLWRAWHREKKRKQEGLVQHGGHNKILRLEQH